MFMIALIICNVFMAWAMTEIGKESTALELAQMNVTGVPTEEETSVGVLSMLWDVATFNIEGIPKGVQVLVFGTLNICMAVAILFLLRGVG